MTIVIGTPVRDIKAYSIGRWLKAISLLDWPDSITVIAVDNTDDTEQTKFATFFNTKIIESDITTEQNPIELLTIKDVLGLGSEPRLARARESFRNRLIALGADVWFSLECDIIPPPETLKVLTSYLADFDIVRHDYPDRDNKTRRVNGIGCALVKLSVLNQLSFLEGGGYGQEIDLLEPNCWYSGDGWLMRRAMRAGFKTVDLCNVLSIQHLNETE